MKKQYYIALVVLICMSLPEKVLGQNQSTASLLVGTWSFNYEDSFKKMEPSATKGYSRMPQARQQTIEKSYKGRKITFNADGNYLQVLADGRKATGRWTLIKNDKSIEITDPNGNKYLQRIEEITSTALVLKPENLGTSKMFISEWHYTKH